MSLHKRYELEAIDEQCLCTQTRVFSGVISSRDSCRSHHHPRIVVKLDKVRTAIDSVKDWIRTRQAQCEIPKEVASQQKGTNGTHSSTNKHSLKNTTHEMKQEASAMREGNHTIMYTYMHLSLTMTATRTPSNLLFSKARPMAYPLPIVSKEPGQKSIVAKTYTMITATTPRYG
jgi:hypothetical protein